MAKYRLTWRGTGALDLSQVLDECGVPVLFTKPGDSVLLNAGTFRHPLVQSCIGHGIEVETIGLPAAPMTSPAPLPPALRIVAPVVTSPPPLPPPPPPPVQEPVIEAPTPAPSPSPEVIPDTEPVPVVEEVRPVEAVNNLPDRGRRGPRGRSR